MEGFQPVMIGMATLFTGTRKHLQCRRHVSGSGWEIAASVDRLVSVEAVNAGW